MAFEVSFGRSVGMVGMAQVGMEFLTTKCMRAGWSGFPEGEVMSAVVLADRDQHNTAVVGEVAINGQVNGSFDLNTDFKAVPERALLHLILFGHNGMTIQRTTRFDVFAHFSKAYNKNVAPLKPMSDVKLELGMVEVAAGKRDFAATPLRFIFRGLAAPKGTNYYSLSFGVGEVEVPQGGIMAHADKNEHAIVVELPFCNERFVGAEAGKGIQVNPILRAIRSDDHDTVLAETQFPFTLGEFKPNEGDRQWPFSLNLGNADRPIDGR